MGRKYSGAIDYYAGKGLLEIIKLDTQIPSRTKSLRIFASVRRKIG